MENKFDQDKGLIWIPYVFVTTSTMINGEVVWYKNKWKNLLLKIKRLFIRPKHFEFLEYYKNKPINPKLYERIKIIKK